MNINNASMPPSAAVSNTSPSWPLGSFPLPGRVDSHANSHPLPHQLQHPQGPSSQGSSQQQQQQHPQWHPHPFPQSHRAFGPPPSNSGITNTNNLNLNYSNGNGNNLTGSGNVNPNVSVNRPPTANVQVRRPHAATTAGRFRSATRVPDLSALNNLRITSNTAPGKTNVDDSSSSDEDFRSTGARPQTAQRPVHRRSMSHPFPSLFSSKKKKTYQMYAGDSESEPVDEVGYAPKLGTIRPPTQQSRGHRNVPSTGNKDYSTGNCMTCGSLVRWPRELSVFKCTICLTVNDLQPTSSTQGQGQGPRRDASRNSPPAVEERGFAYGKTLSSDMTLCLLTFV